MRLPKTVGAAGGAGGGYELRSELGRGGMGVVYLARDVRLDREVAVKALPGAVGGESSRLERLKQEARLLATLNHPNVAQIYSLEEWEGTYYLVLEYVPGQSLGQYVRDHALRVGELAEMLGVLAQVARGVEAAHSRGLIHRDLKPDNIRVTPAPERAAKVLDFGLAKVVGEAAGAASGAGGSEIASDTPTLTTVEIRPKEVKHGAAKTRHGAIVGTPGYMSPEQARGQPTDKGADVWALGCICFESLTGRRAFVGGTLSDSLAATLLGEPEWSLLPAALPAELRGLLKRCLVKDSAQRTVQAHELRAALEQAAGGSVSRSMSPVSVSTMVEVEAPEAEAGNGGGTPTPNNLPRQMTTFVGRGVQLAEVKRLVSNGALVTLIGSAGCGKTRLAQRVASELLGEFPDGVWMVELAGVSDGRMVAAAIAAEIGVREEAGSSLVEKLIEALRGKRVLMLLDNCEHVLRETAGLAEKLLRACRGLKVLATSREALGVSGESVWRVPSLSLPTDDGAVTENFSRGSVGSGIHSIGRTPTPSRAAQAVMQSESAILFLERARSAKPSFSLGEKDAAIVAKICRRLDGIPLAIELAAAKVKMLSVEQIFKKLDDRFRILSGGSRTALERHQTLRAAIDWSIQLLTPPERELLLRLSVFWGGFDLESAEKVCSDDADIGPGANEEEIGEHAGDAATMLPESEVLETLTRLVDKSMVVVEDSRPNQEGDSSPRYRLLESVRQHVTDSLASGGGREALTRRDRHQRYFAALAMRAKPELRGAEQKRWLALLDSDHDNLIAAIRWGEGERLGQHDRRAERALVMIGALVEYWFARGHLSLGRTIAKSALSCADSQMSSDVRGRALVAAGVLARGQGELDEALSAFEKALALLRAANDRKGESSTLLNIGNVWRQRGELDKAWGLYDEALKIRREVGDESGEADVLINLGAVARQRGGLNLARDLYGRAGTIFERRGDRLALSRVTNNLGTIAEDMGDLEGASGLYESSVRLCQESGYAPGLALALNNLGAVATARGQHGRASVLMSEALEIRRSLADKGGLAMSLEAVCDLAIAGGEHVRAARLSGAALALREATGLRRSARRSAQIEAALAGCRAMLGEGFEVEVKVGRETPVEALVEETLGWLDAKPTI